MPSNLNQPGESAAYKDVKDYTGATAEPFDKQIEANKRKRDRFIQGAVSYTHLTLPTNREV